MTESADHRLDEGFDGPGLDRRLSWRNPPVRAELAASRLTVVTAAGTDFWQRTHYGFVTIRRVPRPPGVDDDVPFRPRGPMGSAASATAGARAGA